MALQAQMHCSAELDRHALPDPIRCRHEARLAGTMPKAQVRRSFPFNVVSRASHYP